MIIQKLLNLITGWIAGWLQSIPPLPPDLLSTLQAVPGQIQTVVNDASMLGPVVPFSQIGIGLGIVLYAFLVALIVAVMRKVISLMTGGGM
ncbi:hypothetical protein GALL_248660 [mine drainage metagenome]|uniref:Uncharacterized protein n=1 Tax=mine drainage metagenome TaxID=410659 RepID=A0A1J5RAQ7_9ZZZZ